MEDERNEMKLLKNNTGMSKTDRIKNKLIRWITDVRREMSCKIDRSVQTYFYQFKEWMQFV